MAKAHLQRECNSILVLCRGTEQRLATLTQAQAALSRGGALIRTFTLIANIKVSNKPAKSPKSKLRFASVL